MKIRIIQNNIIPPKDFAAITLWPFILCRKALRDVDVNHELIHCRQQVEMLIAGCVLATVLAICGCGWWSLLAVPVFFWWYVTEWLVRLALYRSQWEAYHNISFEQEAYNKQADHSYLSERTPFAWVGYITRRTIKRKKI